ncbi:hypothetical protein KUCAC02_019657 [Chaenocephalus aceratus]|uniref:Uncharacterized protein n=1 Tax=Chaenocephalus aceratus TaxID=36190 RepID=A0ACB9VP97_CHAAC|nr:hypothetical protein KUCAC02_019657 [Chaenocephalus aceratus]
MQKQTERQQEKGENDNLRALAEFHAKDLRKEERKEIVLKGQRELARICRNRLIPRHVERDSLHIAIVDMKSSHLPSLSRAGDTAEKPHYGSKHAGKPFKTCSPFPMGICEPVRSVKTAETEAIKQYQERDKLQIPFNDIRNVCLQDIILASKETSAGRNTYHSKVTEERLPKYHTQQIRALKEKLRLEERQLAYKTSSGSNLQRTVHPSIKTPEIPAGRPLPPTGVESSQYRRKGTEERLPNFQTPKMKSAKDQLRLEQIQLAYKANSGSNLQRTLLPSIKTAEIPAGRPLPPTVVESSQYRRKGTEERLPNFQTPKMKSVKDQLRLEQLQLAYKANSGSNLQRTLLPSIKTAEIPAGRPLPPTGVESSQYRRKGTDKRLPNLHTTQMRATKAQLRVEQLQLAYKANSG